MHQGHVLDLAGLPAVEQLLADQAALAELVEPVAKHAARIPLERVRPRAPLRPRRLLGTGTNYRSHVDEMGFAPPPEPSAWLKLPGTVCGPEDPVVLPSDSRAIDYEGELAVVIGRRVHRPGPEEARRAIAGLTLCNEVSARDLLTSQIVLAKGSPGFCPLGPALVTTDELDLDAIEFRVLVNDEERQAGHSADMIHGMVEIVVAYARWLPLEPGDVLLTGTPGGVGAGMSPPRLLADGDVVVVTSPQLGTLRNRFVAER